MACQSIDRLTAAASGVHRSRGKKKFLKKFTKFVKIENN